MANLTTARAATASLCAETTNADGSELTIASPAAVGAGQRLEVVVPGLSNPTQAGVRELSVQASLAAAATVQYRVVPAGAVSALSLSRSDPSARASQVTYTVEFKASPTGALAAGTGTVTFTLPPGTFPAQPSCSLRVTVTDITTRATAAAPFCSQVVLSGGSQLVVTSPVMVGGGDEIEVVIPGLDNPSQGPHELAVGTSSDGTESVGFGGAASSAVSDLSLSRSDPSALASDASYTIEFKASPTGGLVAGTGTITFTLPPGTFPAQPSCSLRVTVTDITTKATGTAPLCSQMVPKGGSQLVLTSPVMVGGGDEVEVVIPGLDNPAQGPHELAVGTSSDAAESVGFATSPASSVRDVGVSVSTLAGSVAEVIYAVTFTTSGSGALAAGIGVVALGAPPGTFPESPKCGEVVATIADVATGAKGQDDLCRELVDKDGSSVQLVTPVPIGTGQTVRVLISGLHRTGALARGTASVSTSADAAPVAYHLGSPGAPLSDLSVSLSSPAAGATRVTYTLEFTTSGHADVPAGSGGIVVSAPAGTFPAKPVCGQALATVTDLTTKSSGHDDLCSAAVAANGSQLQLTTPVAVGGGQRVRLALSGLANPLSPGRQTIHVATSSNSSTGVAYGIVAGTSVSGPALVLSNPAAGLAGVTYGASFTASANGELATGSGLIYLVLPEGTWPSSKLCGADGATITDLATKATGEVFNCSVTSDGGRESLSLQVPVSVAAGDKVGVAVPGLANPAQTGGHSAWLSTSSDGQPHSVQFRTFPSGRVSGSVRDSSGYPVAGAEVEACPPGGGQCLDTVAVGQGAFTEVVPFGRYVLSVFPPSTPQGSELGTYTSPSPVLVDSPQGAAKRNLVMRVLQPLPEKASLSGQDGGVPHVSSVYSAQFTVRGCQHGVGIVTVQGTSFETGQVATKVVPLLETPPGSGRYSATIPPLEPIHGTTTFSYKIYCFEAVLPKAGPSSGGNVVLLHGSGFKDVTAVKFGTTASPHFKALSSSVIEAIAPPGSGAVDVSVTTKYGTTPGGPSTYSYISLSSVTPSYGSGTGSTEVEITGQNLKSVDTIWFGDQLARGTRLVSNHELVAYSPPGSGTVPVRIGEIAYAGPSWAGRPARQRSTTAPGRAPPR